MAKAADRCGKTYLSQTGDSQGKDSWEMRIKLLVPRVSEVGYFKEVELSIEETSRMPRQSIEAAMRRTRRVSILDLTGDDE